MSGAGRRATVWMLVLAAATVLVGPTASVAAAQSIGNALDVNQTANRTVVDGGATVGVNVTLNATAPRYEGPGLNVTPPAGWNVTPLANDSGSYKPSTNSWVWTSNADIKNVSYALAVPESATGNNTVHGVGSAINTTPDPDERETATDDVTIEVNALPVANFTFSPAQPGVGETVAFNSTGADADGSIVSWSWAFGDGNTSSGENASHSYGSAGDFQVNLTVTDDDGATNAATRTVTVGNDLPTATIGFSPSNPAVGTTVQFDGTGSSDPDGTIAGYAWAFGDGTTGTGATPTHSYGSSGTYTVILTVTDDDGATATATTSVSVSAPAGSGGGLAGGGGGAGGMRGPMEPRNETGPDVPPEPTESPEGIGDANQPSVAAFLVGNATGDGRVVLDASPSYDPDGSLIDREWDLDDDGVYERSGRVVEAELGPGVHTVTLRVTDDALARNTTNRQVNVIERVAEPSDETPVVPAVFFLLVLAAILTYLAVRSRRTD